MKNRVIFLLLIILSLGFLMANPYSFNLYEFEQQINLSNASTNYSLFANDSFNLGGFPASYYATTSDILWDIDSTFIYPKDNYNLSLNSQSILDLNYIDFNISLPQPSSSEGRLLWNSEDGTLEVGLSGGNVNLQIGQEVIIRGKATSNILNGEMIYVSGASGSRPEFTLAKADASATSKGTIAMATEDITTPNNGYGTSFGLVRDIDTSSFIAGDDLYLSPTTAGAITNIAPVQPYFKIKIGYVLRSHATEGIVFININQRTNNYSNILGLTSGSIPYANSHGFLDEDSNFNYDVGTTTLNVPTIALTDGTISTTPSSDFDISNKKYIDDEIALNTFWDRTGTTLSPKTSGDNVLAGGAYGRPHFASQTHPTTGIWLANDDIYFMQDNAIALSIIKTGNIAVGNKNIEFDYDNKGIKLGGLDDAFIYYDGTDLILEPNLVGTGKVLIGATGNDDLEAYNIDVNNNLTVGGNLNSAKEIYAGSFTPVIADALSNVAVTGFGTGGLSAGRLLAQGTSQADLLLIDSGGIVDNKVFQLVNVGGAVKMRYLNDAGTIGKDEIMAISNADGKVYFSYNDVIIANDLNVLTDLEVAGDISVGTSKAHLLGRSEFLSVASTNGVYSELGNLGLIDSRAQAEGTGGQIMFGGKYTDAGDYTRGASIRMAKKSSTTGDYGFGLEFATRAHNADLAKVLDLTSDGNVEITNDLTVTGDLYADGSDLTNLSLFKDLKLWLPFEVGSQTRDHSGNGNDGVVSNAIWNSTGGYDGFGAYDFNGVSDKITVTDTLDFSKTDAFSISVLIKTSTSGQDSSIISDIGTSPYTGIDLHVAAPAVINPNQDAITLWIISTYPTNMIEINGAINVVDGNWHRITATYDGSGLASGAKIYVDGVLDTAIAVDTLTGSINNALDWTIGDRVTGSTQFTGTIDEPMIFSRELSAEEVVRLYNHKKVETGFLDDVTMESDLTIGGDLTVNGTNFFVEGGSEDLVWDGSSLKTGRYLKMYYSGGPSTGTITYTTNRHSFSGRISSGVGTEGAPHFASNTDTNTGFYFAGSDTFKLVTGGTSRITITDATTSVTNDLNTKDIKIDGTSNTTGIVYESITSKAYAQTAYHNGTDPLVINLVTEDVYVNVTGLHLDYNSSIYINGQATINKTGMYHLTGSISFSGGNSGRYRYNLFVNDLEEHACGAMRTTTSTSLGSMSLNCLVYLEQGDLVNMRVKDTTSPVQDVEIYTLTLNMVEI